MPPGTLPNMNYIPTIVYGPFFWQRGAVRLALRSKADILVVLGDVKVISSWLVLIIARVRGVPALLWTIGWHRREIGVKRLRMTFYRMAKALLVYGRTGKQLGKEAGYPDHRMFVVGIVYPPRQQCLLRVIASFPVPILPPLRKRVILSVGRLTPIKQYDLLLRAVDTDQILKAESTIVLVGEGTERLFLESQAKELDIDLRLVGSVYGLEQLAPYYAHACVTVIPGAAGLTAVQSISFGVPVITHDDPEHQMPEFEAVVPGVTGDFFQFGDPRDLAGVIRRWTANERASGHASLRSAVQNLNEPGRPPRRRLGFPQSL